jgi:hypothetical protein
MKRILPILMLFLGGCFLLGPQEEQQTDTDINIKSSTAKKIELQPGSLVDIYEESSSSSSNIRFAINRAKTKKTIDYDIRYIARTLPVSVAGLDVQANDIIIKGNEAYVAYNYAGELFKGAIQIIDISNADEPEITQEILFEEMDVNTLYLDGNKLIFGGAANPEIYSNKSFVGVIPNVKSFSINQINDSLTYFTHSHGVTSISKQGSDYYIGVGAESGKIYITDNNFNISTTIDKADVRDIEEYTNGVVAIKGTTDNTEDAKIMLVKNDAVVKELSLDDFSSDYNKVTIEMYNNELAFVGMSALGFRVYDISENDEISSVFTLDNPDNDSNHVTNSVSFDNKLAFVANGEYGVRLIDIKDVSKSASGFGEVLGFIDFEGLEDESGQNYSANHVAYKSNYLFVASGVGGVNIYTVEEN